MVSPYVPVLYACTCSIAVVGGWCVDTIWPVECSELACSSIQFLIIPTDALECVIVSKHRHVSATHVAIFRVAGTRIKSQL